MVNIRFMSLVTGKVKGKLFLSFFEHKNIYFLIIYLNVFETKSTDTSFKNASRQWYLVRQKLI